MSKLSDQDTPGVRITLFADELKAIKRDGNEITEELIDFLSSQYAAMPCMSDGFYTLTVFERDFSKAEDVFYAIDSVDRGNRSVYEEKLDEADVDYILEREG